MFALELTFILVQCMKILKEKIPSFGFLEIQDFFNATYFYYLYFKDILYHEGCIVTLHNIKYIQML